MKERYACGLAFILLMAASLCAEDSAITRVKITNGDMTLGSDRPIGWDQSWAGEGKLRIVRDTETFHTGPGSLRVETVGGAAKGNAFTFVDAPGGATVEVVGWVKTGGGVRCNLFIQSFSKDFKALSFDQIGYLHDNAAYDWTEFRKRITLHKDAARFGIGLLVEGNGKAWLDDVRDVQDEPFKDTEPKKKTVVGNLELEPAPEGDPSSTPLPNGKPWIPGWCRWDWRAAWVGTHSGFIENTKKNPGRIDVIFYGDSITQGWGDGVKAYVKSIDPTLEAVNYGIGGDSTRQLLYRIADREVEGLKPKVVVLKIGTNNLYDDANGGSDEEIAKGIELAAKLLRAKLPETKILLLAILPRQNDWFCGRAKRINALTAKLDDGRMVRVLNMWDAFYDPTSTEPNCRVKKDLFVKDLLHLDKKGYEVWGAAMRTLLSELLK